jgi:sarcosine oxidase, subunit gamma
MNAALRTSPLHAALSALKPRWQTYQGMQIPLSVGSEVHLETVALTELSCRKRFGLKGPGAEKWLQEQGVPVPPSINQWAPLGKCGLIARLATTEFFIEDGSAAENHADQLRDKLQRGLPGVTPVLRQDAEIAMSGPAAYEILAQTCSVNFAALDLAARPLVMTSMIGVSVLVIPGLWEGKLLFQIWCDCTFAPYLWEHLLEIAQELGGGAVGIGALFPNLLGEQKP